MVVSIIGREMTQHQHHKTIAQRRQNYYLGVTDEHADSTLTRAARRTADDDDSCGDADAIGHVRKRTAFGNSRRLTMEAGPLSKSTGMMHS